MYNARRKAKKGIFISDDLTRHRQDIFYKARQHQKAGTFSHTWTKDGRILVRLRNGDVRQISTIFDLDTTVDAVSENDRQKVLQTRRGPGTQRVIVDRSHVQSNEQSADGQLSTTDHPAASTGVTATNSQAATSWTTIEVTKIDRISTRTIFPIRYTAITIIIFWFILKLRDKIH